MKRENPSTAGFELPGGRITRARAAACSANGAVIPSITSFAKPEKKKAKQNNSKRTVFDENSGVPPYATVLQHKKHAVLKDVTNISCVDSSKDCIQAIKIQFRASQHVTLGPSKAKGGCNSRTSKPGNDISVQNALTYGIAEAVVTEGILGTCILGTKDSVISVKVEENLLALKPVESINAGESTCRTALFGDHNFREQHELVNHSKNGNFTCLDYINIDADLANPQMCCIYAPEIYANLRSAELIRRPFPNFMELLQRDITQSMRGILIDWLVEVSEEYKLVPDTLYLTIYLIDQFLSQNYIERQRLQLLGITCMLIASKYEEICAPRVEEFCFITDNTYNKAEVLKMESLVLNYLRFQLSVPTIKTFLRRFLLAAQASNKVPSLALGFLSNYLAELTLVEYSFVKFLPSVVAASAVFLARWTLDQSDHPWNSTLEHYTSYKAMDLRTTVFALQELQLNSNNCPLNAIRDKYKQPKFESVATLTSPMLLQSLFC